MFKYLSRATGALMFAIALPAAACDSAAGTPVIHLKVYAPLSADSGPATDVAIDATGCVTSRFNSIDKRHGVHRLQLGGKEFARLKREIQASGVAGFDAAKIARPAPLAEGATRWRVSDPDIVELTLAPGYGDAVSKRATKIRFTDVDGALMNRPDVAGLQALGAVKSRLVELSEDTRLQKEAGQ